MKNGVQVCFDKTDVEQMRGRGALTGRVTLVARSRSVAKMGFGVGHVVQQLSFFAPRGLNLLNGPRLLHFLWSSRPSSLTFTLPPSPSPALARPVSPEGVDAALF